MSQPNGTPSSAVTPQTNETAKFKIVFLGEQGVGKSSIISRLARNEVPSSYSPTIGIDFVSHDVKLDNRTVHLQIWDTAGQERFRSLIPSYLHDADVAVIVYDVTCESSFAQTRQWFNYVNRQSAGEIAIILVGNKCDLSDSSEVVSCEGVLIVSDYRKISFESGQEIAAAWNCRHMEVSAVVGYNIQELFELVGGTVVHEKRKNYEETDRIKLAYGDEKSHDEQCGAC